MLEGFYRNPGRDGVQKQIPIEAECRENQIVLKIETAALVKTSPLHRLSTQSEVVQAWKARMKKESIFVFFPYIWGI